jgi:glycosyltransferase involved in cell wall biosynthesis
MKKVSILIDPAHDKWVLGGLMREVALENNGFFIQPKFISRLKSKYVIASFFLVMKLSILKRPIIFSSITPFENYLKYSKLNRNKKILVFTHQDGNFSNKLISIIQKSDLIFVFSSKDKIMLKNIGIKAPIIVFIGGINEKLFNNTSKKGNKIVFIGTSVERKNPKIFLDFAESNKHLSFKILGKEWKKSEYWSRVETINNIEYQEICGPLTSLDLFDCSHQLMLSRTEGGPITLIETVAAGLIPVCTDTGIVSEFLNEVGYGRQIIKYPITFTEIVDKLNIRYSENLILNSTAIAKQYSIKRLSDLFKNTILSSEKNWEI